MVTLGVPPAHPGGGRFRSGIYVANAMNRSLALAALVLALMAFGDAGDMTAADKSLSLRVARALPCLRLL